MILPSQSLFKARQALARKLKRRELTPQEVLSQFLELDPCDGWAWHGLALYALETGDLAKAEECAWRALQTHPFRPETYLLLARLTHGRQKALSDGLLELGLRKLLNNPRALQEYLGSQDDREAEAGDEPLFHDAEDLTGLADLLRRKRIHEPRAVSDRLSPYRLVHEVQVAEEGALERRTVDRILENSRECAPLLVGLLRGWGLDELPPNGDFAVCASLALLGQTGDPELLPALLEFAALENERVRDAADWAVAQIGGRRPAETLAQFRSLAPRASPIQVSAMAVHLASMPPVSGGAEWLLEQLHDFGRHPKDERDAVFLALALGYLKLAWPESRRDVAGLVGRYRRRLDLSTIKMCEEMIARCQTAPPPSPLLYEQTIYDLCCRAYEHERPGPEVRPGRNAPCWCGSGKKYKKCHMHYDESARSAQAAREPAGDVVNSLRSRLAAFLKEALRPSEIEGAMKAFFGRAPHRREVDEAEQLCFIEWLIWDHRPKRLGRTLIEEYSLRHGRDLDPEVRGLLAQWAGSCVSLYEVEQVRPEGELKLKDLLRDQTVRVHDVSASQQLVRWDCVLTRVLEGSPDKQLAAASLMVPRSTTWALRQWILEDRESRDLPWDSYLRQRSHRVRQQAVRMIEEAAERFRFVSAEGDPLVFSKAAYGVKDRAAVLAALESCELLSRDPGEGPQPDRFTWFETAEPVEGRRRVLGNLRLEADRLIVECLSQPRLRRARELVESLAGAALRHQGDEFAPWRAALERLEKEQPRESRPSEIPPEVAREVTAHFFAEHYRKWLDTPLPVLNGRTPRQAARLPEARTELEELLKLVENAQERRRMQGEPFFDVGILRRDLGLPD